MAGRGVQSFCAAEILINQGNRPPDQLTCRSANHRSEMAANAQTQARRYCRPFGVKRLLTSCSPPCCEQTKIAVNKRNVTQERRFTTNPIVN